MVLVLELQNKNEKYCKSEVMARLRVSVICGTESKDVIKHREDAII